MAWYEIVVEGDAGAWERLLAEQEAGIGQRAVRGADVPLRPESAGERLHDLLHARSRHLAFVPGELASGLVAGLAPPATLAPTATLASSASPASSAPPPAAPPGPP